MQFKHEVLNKKEHVDSSLHSSKGEWLLYVNVHMFICCEIISSKETLNKTQTIKNQRMFCACCHRKKMKNISVVD